MSKDNLKLLNLKAGATKDEIYESYIHLRMKYKKENSHEKLAELDRVYGELLITEHSKVSDSNQFKLNTVQFVLISILIILTLSVALYYKLAKGSPERPVATQTDSNDSSLSDDVFRPLVPLGEDPDTQSSFVDPQSTDAMLIADANDPRLQISNKEKVDVVVSYINTLKKDSNAQGKIMSCYFKYQNKKEPGVPCAYMDAAAEYALNTPGKSSSIYFTQDAVTERANLHLYSVNNVSESVAYEHMKQIRFDVSQIITDIALKQAQRIGANQEQARPQQNLFIDQPPESENSEDDAVRAAQMAAAPALTQ